VRVGEETGRLSDNLKIVAEQNEKTKSWITQFLDRRLTAMGERALFDLPATVQKPEGPSSGSPPQSAAH
jgi:hypothetical protein